MKQTFTFSMIFLLLGLLASDLQAQADSGLNFQAVARDASGNLITNGSIAVRFFIQQTTPTIATVYSETHTGVSTDAFGLFSLVMGTGTPIFGNFSSIDWGSSPFQVLVRVDVTGSGVYELVGTVPLQKSPKAYFADEAAIADSVRTAHLAGLDDVAITPGSLQNNDIIKWDGNNWVREPLTTSHTIFIGPMNFQPANNTYAFARTSGGSYLTTATTAPMYAPLNLPVGSVITSVRAHYYDNSTTNLQIRIFRVFQTSSGLSTVASLTTSGASSLFRNSQMAISLSPIADNHFYHIQVNPLSGTWSSNTRIRGIEVTYTLP